MARIGGIQHRNPYAGSSRTHSTYNHWVDTDGVEVEQYGNNIQLFFHRSGYPGQGVGLSMPKEAAGAIGHLLLAVGTGAVTRTEGRI